MVKRRVEEELEKRRDEIELEVKRRVEQAKIEMEREMMLELERRREQIREEERRREVGARIQEFCSELGATVRITTIAPSFLKLNNSFIYFFTFLISLSLSSNYIHTINTIFPQFTDIYYKTLTNL